MGGDEYVCYPDCGYGFVGVCIYPNSTNVYIKCLQCFFCINYRTSMKFLLPSKHQNFFGFLQCFQEKILFRLQEIEEKKEWEDRVAELDLEVIPV